MNIRKKDNLINRASKLAEWGYLLLGFGFLFLPIFALVLFSFEDSRLPTLPWTGWTLDWYGVLFSDGRLIEALKYSLIVSPVAATIATVIGFLASYTLNRFDFIGKRILSIMMVVPILIPPLILGVAFLGLLSRINLQGTLLSVVLTHIVILIPTAIALVTIRLAQMPKDLEQAAWNLGASELQGLLRVVLPWSIPGIAGAWLLAFTFSFDEFVIAWFVSGFQPTLPVAIYSMMAFNLDPSLNAIGTIIFAISVLLLVGVEIVLMPILLDSRSKLQQDPG
jgi:spermidine/putrescine transport system permease protein